MIKFCDKENIRIVATDEPCTCVRTISPLYTKEEIKDIKKKPYLNKRNVTFIIWANNEEYRIFIPKGYTWDGASIPALFRPLIGGKGKQEFLIPSMVHDKLCECHWLINNDRELSSLIFKELLLACGVGRVRANTMHFAVNQFQKFCGWKDKK